MKGFAIHNAPTDHGGQIPSTQDKSSQQGNTFVRAGDGHMCPKCKVWSTVQSSHSFIIFDGKPVAFVGDSLSCGAKITDQQTHVVGTSGGGLGSISPISIQPMDLEPSQSNNLVDKQNSIKPDDKAYYKWWWGDLESKNPETVAQEKNNFLRNFSNLHDEYAHATTYKVYEIDPKAWDGEVAFDFVFPNAIQSSVDKFGDLGKALSKLAVGCSANVVWENISVGNDYLKTGRSKQWPHGRWLCIAYGTITKLDTDQNGRVDFQFKGYVKILDDLYSWDVDGNGFQNELIKQVGGAVEMITGTKDPAPVYNTGNPKTSGLPTTYVRKYFFDYYKKGINKPKY